jgi:NAD(P)-dependent dehydrogenase (short-subunit alcohol dehydrogenase family)
VATPQVNQPVGEERTSRVVVVTGGTRGVGCAIAERFRSDGSDVLAVGREQCDVTDEAAVESFFASLEVVDVLVNNAGISETAPLHRTTLTSWQRQLAVNATGVFLCTRAVVAGMRARGSGTVITVASTAARAATPYIAAYAASKHAAVGLMRATAAELAGSGATANAVCPTFVDTDMTRASAARIAERTGRSVADSIAELAAMSPLGRLLDPAEIAEAVHWLASPAAGAINGQTLVLDGGGLQA